MAKPNPLIDEIRSLLDQGGGDDSTLQAVLAKVLEAFQCPVGTIHSLDADSGMLKLRALSGIPPSILDKVRVIPIGKGMAGIAAERKQPVQVCNLQTDASGVAKPAAKDTKMEGSITVPMLQQGNLRGTLGVAKPVPYEFSDDETRILMEAGSLISGYLK